MATYKRPTEYQDRLNSLIEKRRSNAQGWADAQKREQMKAEQAQKAAETKNKRGWGLPTLLGGGLGMLLGGPAGAAWGAGIGGGLGLMRAGKSRGGGLGGMLESLVDVPGAIEPIMENPASVMPLMGAFAPYMKGLGGAGKPAAPSLNDMSGYGWDLADPTDTFGSEYAAGDYGANLSQGNTLAPLDVAGPYDPNALEDLSSLTAPGEMEYGGGAAQGSGIDLSWMEEDEDEE